jgi:hypothetical protein
MWNWIKRRELIARHLTASDAPAAQPFLGIALRRAKVPRKYAPLHDSGRILDQRVGLIADHAADDGGNAGSATPQQRVEERSGITIANARATR